MNFIINGFSDVIYAPVVANILNRFEINRCHIIYGGLKNDIQANAEVFFHDAADLSLGNYNVNWNQVAPLDEELIESMSDCERIVLKMMDRHLYIPKYKDRKRLYLRHLRYWNHVINEQKIDLFLSSAPAHEVYDFIIYSLCKLKKVPTICLFQIMAADVIMIIDDWERIIPEIEEKYQKLLETFKFIPESEIELTGGLKNDFDLQMSKNDATPHYMIAENKKLTFFDGLVNNMHNFKKNNPISLIRRLPSTIGRMKYDVEKKINEKRLFDFYERNVTELNTKEKFIYFPLHMQPEATTSPAAGVFVDQILTAQMVASFLPKDVYLYVKEHPFQTIYGRDIEFYKELLDLPQVRLVSKTFNTFELISNSIAVATATGTAGWEALYRGKPVLLFGHCYYQYVKGVFAIRTNDDCRQALRKIIVENFKPTTKDIKIYLKALEEYTINGFIDPVYQTVSGVTDLASNKNIISKLTSRIELVCLIKKNG